jgi:hypothetical protein
MEGLKLKKIMEEIVRVLMESVYYWDLSLKERHQLVKKLMVHWG